METQKTENTPRLFEVGGSIRDTLIGIPSKDRDFVLTVQTWDALKTWCEIKMDRIFLKQEEFLTIRGFMGGMPMDVTACVSTIEENIAHRDFSMNAMACEVNPDTMQHIGPIIDQFGGNASLQEQEIRCVGNPKDRIKEDPIRLIRAMRFSVTMDFTLEQKLASEMFLLRNWIMLDTVAPERIQQELKKSFAADTAKTLKFLATNVTTDALEIIFKNIKLKPIT